METNHRIIIDDAAGMEDLGDQTIDLVVTSPPYPMIQMWDELFSSLDPKVAHALERGDTMTAFEAMHCSLDKVWEAIARVTKPGGIICVNIGDATRTINGRFALYANHARIIRAFQKLGCDQLPTIIWRKPTNAPNKFMGSGMLPPSAYVTLEHEYILIFRQGSLRPFATTEEKRARRHSAYFWEERNAWFSDVWFDLLGTAQAIRIENGRERSAAFPFELPYRLISMFSIAGDKILDPFLGTGTTLLAAMATGRHSIGYETDPSFKSVIIQRLTDLPALSNRMIERRLADHAAFIEDRVKSKGGVKNFNHIYNMPVITRQEEDLCLAQVRSVKIIGSDHFKVTYEDPRMIPDARKEIPQPQASIALKKGARGRQLKLF